jgi:hypothetical protein
VAVVVLDVEVLVVGPALEAPPLEALDAAVAVAGEADTERDLVKQEVSVLFKTLKVADWPTAPVLSRKFRKPEEPTGRLTFQVTDVPDCEGNETRGAPLGCPAGKMLKK